MKYDLALFEMCFVCDAENGSLRWKDDYANKEVAGKEAGSCTVAGYKTVGILGTDYLVHRVIWLMHYKSLPEMLDHIDRNPRNNRIDNLRETTHKDNLFNRGPKKSNPLGVRGVSYHPLQGAKPYRVRLREGGVMLHSKYYATFGEAKAIADAFYRDRTLP